LDADFSTVASFGTQNKNVGEIRGLAELFAKRCEAVIVSKEQKTLTNQWIAQTVPLLTSQNLP
jgi:hypothetical protein